MKKILIVSGSAIHPAITGGTIHTLGIARSLARMGHTVHIYGFAGRAEQYGQGKGCLEREVEPRLTQHIHLGWFNGLLQTLMRRIGMPRLWQFELMRRGWVPASLKQAVEAADIVFGDMPHTPPLPGVWGQKPWYLISHNLEWRLLQQSSAKEQRWAGRMKQIESEAPARYRDIVAVTTEDRDFFRAHDAGKTLKLPIVGSGVDPDAYRVPAGTRERVRAELGVADDERLIIFSGSRFGPNTEALESIRRYSSAQAVWLAAQRVRFVVVGTVVTEPFREGALIGVGRVAEIAPYFAAADAGLNPVSTGSGANVKLFEYLALRLPVISTAFGVRGSELLPEQDYLPCEPADYTAAISTLCAQPREHWLQYSEAIWQRHKQYCDMVELVRSALPLLDAFN